MRLFCSLFLLTLSLASGCSSMPNANEPAMPSSKALRQPINRLEGDEAFSRKRDLDDRERVQRVPLNAEASQAPLAERDARFPVTTRYVFGVSNPVVTCAVSHVCDVELQAGEKITVAPRIGDKSRWGVDLVMSGQGSTETPHLTIMPLEAGAETSLVVITNKRTYHLFLRAGRMHYMLHTVFTYPEDMNARWNALVPASSAQPSLQAVTPNAARN